MFKKVNAIDTRGLVKKTDYNTKIKDIEDKITNVITNTARNAKIKEVKNEMPRTNGLATALNDVKNNIPDVSTLVK